MPTTIQDIQNALIKHKKPPKEAYRLYRVPGTPEVYELSDWQVPTTQYPGGYGTKRHIPSPAAFEEKYGKEAWAKVKPITTEELAKYGAIGEAKPEVKVEPSGLGVEVGAEPVPATQDYSKIWETEYGKSGLEDVKTQIGGLDTDITARKTARDKALLDEKGKPIPQWMITGRKALEVEAATNDLNRMIDERNTLAGQYNTGIANVERQVGYAIDYQKELARGLREESAEERWEREFGLKLTEAEKPRTTVSEYEVGGRLIRDTINTLTGEVIKREDLGVAPAGRDDEWTPTQKRAAERETELLNDVIRKYKEEWPKKGDKGLGTREALTTRAIKEFGSLTPEMVRDAIYEQITDEWLTENIAGPKWWQIWK